MKELINILTLGLVPLYKKHYSLFAIFEEFRNKLPRKQNEARKMSSAEIEKNPVLRNYKYMTVIDLSTQKVNISESDIDLFYNKLNNFDYNFILFKKYYKRIIRNLNRFNPKAENKNFDIAIVKDLLTESDERPLKPFSVLLYHIKYEYKLTSWYYKWKIDRELKHNNIG